jgi:predicted RNA-binding Zn ribbon-like protein
MTAARQMLIGDVGADLCLAYANSLSWRGRATPIETLHGFGDLLTWAAGSAGLSEDISAELERWAQAQPASAAALFDEAIALREAIYRIFSALASGEPVGDRDLAVLNQGLAEAPRRDQLIRKADGHAWRIKLGEITAPTLLAQVLWSAGDLMVDERRRRVRLCANEDCLWLFLDESKAGTRRWCDMTSCGNRAKARRHYQRSKATP